MPMASASRPPELEASHAPTADELKALPAIGHTAVHILEECIAEHHIAEVGYSEPDEPEETVRLRPAFIRTSTAHHIVVWGFPVDADHWIELRLDRIHRVRDTGEMFQPGW